MCILIVLRDRVEGYPLVVGSNRDEFRDRPWEGPIREGGILAPRDLRAGGTWIALGDSGLLVAVTNLPDKRFDPAFPSRGLLAAQAARAGSVGEARELLVEEVFRTTRNAFQMLVADAENAWVVIGKGKRACFQEEQPVGPGLHTLTNQWGLDELEDEGALAPLDLPAGTPIATAIPAMKAALGTHGDAGPGDEDAICKHDEDRGTLSSAIVALPAPGSGLSPVFLFAAGAPCETEYEVVT